MKAADEHLLIFERHFSPEKRCRPPLGWGIMPSACFPAPLPRGLVEGASAGQHVAAGAAWVDLPEANPSGRAERERASQYPQRSRPSEQRHNDERRGPRRSLRTKPPGGGAEKPSKGGIPKGRHCFAGAKCRSSSPQDETVGRRRGKNRQMASALAAGCGDPSQRPQSLWLRGVARGPAVLASRFACPVVTSHPLRLYATASMRFNQRFPQTF